jgi:N-acyl-L-homoserine lactone synthetase
MKIFKEIHFKTKENKKKKIYFGMPSNPEELKEMFRLRYDIFLQKGYISKESFPDGLERDEYDIKGKCYYFIAKIDDQIIGTARLIRSEVLPAEKECFRFIEPKEMKEIPPEKRVEVSRVISKGYKINDEFLPRHLILLGLLDSIFYFAQKKDFRGGYSFVRKSLKEKLKKLKIPFHQINHFTIAESHKYLEKYRGYFEDPKDPPVPIYYIRDEMKIFFEKVFNNSHIFKKIDERKFELKRNNKIL